MKAHLGVAARTLALDLVTGEVTRAFDAAGIDCMLLKGPAMARRLYRDAPGGRNYGDVDLLVAPGQFEDAGQVLASLGFSDGGRRIRASEAARLPSRPWRRGGAAPAAVDLHRGFHNVADWSAWWERLSLHRETLVVEGQPVAIPDRVGCAVIAVLHAWSPASPDQPREDLRRALRLFGDETWRQAADLAEAVGAGGAFAATLGRQRAGAELVARIGLSVTDQVGWFRATSRRRGTSALSTVLGPGSWAVRARRVRDVALPSRGALTGTWPIAARGRCGLILAHCGRLCVMAARLPPLLLAWHRASRALRRGDAPAASGRPRFRTGHRLLARAGAAAGTGWWTLRTWRLVRSQLDHGQLNHGQGSHGQGSHGQGSHGQLSHGQLSHGPWHRSEPLPPAVPPAPRTPRSRRTARLVLACCRATCLETALVRQARAAGMGLALDVVVGVTAPSSGFRAHAWLDGDRVDPGFVEIWRCQPAITRAGHVRHGSL